MSSHLSFDISANDFLLDCMFDKDYSNEILFFLSSSKEQLIQVFFFEQSS